MEKEMTKAVDCIQARDTAVNVTSSFPSSTGHQTAHWQRRPEQHDASSRGGASTSRQVSPPYSHALPFGAQPSEQCLYLSAAPLTLLSHLRHKTDADQIEKIAKDANDTSTKAHNLLQKTLQGETKTGQEIEDLNKK